MFSLNYKKEESLKSFNSETMHDGKSVSLVSLKTSLNELSELSEIHSFNLSFQIERHHVRTTDVVKLSSREVF